MKVSVLDCLINRGGDLHCILVLQKSVAPVVQLVFFLFSFPCSADHERDWPPCKVVFFGLATNALNVRNINNNCTKSIVFSSVFLFLHSD